MIRTDLILHFLAGFFIATCFQWLGLWSIVIATVIGIGKELIWDLWLKKGTPDYKDAVLTFAGGFIAYWVNLVMNIL